MPAPTGKTVRLLHVTDPHLYADESRLLYGVNTATSFRRVLAEALGSGPRPHAVLATGDVADDLSPGAYANFRRALEPYGLPVHCVPGNHDRPGTMAGLREWPGFQVGGVADLGTWRALFLDTHVDGRAEGVVRDEELAWLDAGLAASADRHGLVCLHHPPVPVGSAWLDAVGLRNGDDLLRVLGRHAHVRLVVAGHVHQAYDEQHGGCRILTTPSTCAQFTPRTARCVMDDRPPGWRWIELHADGRVDTAVCWLQEWGAATPPVDDRFDRNEELPE